MRKIVLGLLFYSFPTIGFATTNSSALATEPSSPFVEWAKSAAMPLGDLSPESLAPYFKQLDSMLAGKRVVYLGEPDHYVSEKYDFRLMLIRYLQVKGFRHIGMEMGRSDGGRINEYLKTGNVANLNEVCIYGSHRCSRSDRNDIPSGALQTLNPEGRDNFIKEERWFNEQLRSISKTRPLSYFGFDVDTRPGGGYDDIEKLLSRFSRERLIKNFLAKFQRLSGETLAEEVERLSKCISLVESHRSSFKGSLGRERFSEFYNSLLTLRESFQFIQLAFANPSREELLAAYAQRERNVMFRQLDEQLARLPKNEGIILMGHNMHLSKKAGSLHFGRLEDEQASSMWYSIGSYVNDILPGRVFSLWMLYNQGSHWDLKCNAPSCPVKAYDDQIEAELSAVGDTFLLPTTQAPDSASQTFWNPVNFQQNGDYGSGVLGDQADALFFVNTVTAPRAR